MIRNIAIALAVIPISLNLVATSGAQMIPNTEITYRYPLDFGIPGPNEGDSAQPRSDIVWYGDATGRELLDGFIPFGWSTGHGVGFNEFHGTGTGTDTGDPQPRIEFDLGGARDVSSVSITYLTGALRFGVVGPERVEISVSNDGGATYSPTVTYSGFNRFFGTSGPPYPHPDHGDNNNEIIAPTDTVPLSAKGITHVRMDFFQGSHPTRVNTSLWVFLSEMTFFASTVGMPDDTMAPTGAVHAHDNIIWPPNHKLVTVNLEGYVVDELSMARDGGGIGVASAFLLVDGTKIILRDEATNLLGEDGSFSVRVDLPAVKGARYQIDLYATDTESGEAGGPNSGLVDSTFIRVPHDMSGDK